MKEETISDAVLREFLLGGLDDVQRDRIEGQFLTDSQTRERILAAEQDLIEDYLEDSLNDADRTRFISLYAQTAEQRRKLRITKSIKNWAITEAALPKTIPANVLSWARLRNWLRLKPAIVPIAVALMIVVVVVAVWLTRRIEQRNRLAAIEQELAQLNSPSSLREVPPHLVRLDLRPAAVRSNEPQAELKTRDDTQLVELRLPWIKPDRYPNYRAEVRRIDDDVPFMIRNLKAEGDGNYAVRMRLPARHLRKGQYLILLSGIAADGSVGTSEEYIFTVGN